MFEFALRGRAVGQCGWRIAGLLVLMGVTHAAPGADPGSPRLHQVLRLPDWLSVSVVHRTRYESVSRQFRRNGSGGDQV